MPAVPIDESDLYERAAAALAAASPGSDLGPLTRLQGGTSSITYSADLAAGPTPKVVLKVAPAGLDPTKNRDVLRQARIQRALQGTGVPCPVVIAEGAGPSLERPPFYVMGFEEGDCVEPSVLPDGKELPASEVRARELGCARIGGLLHALDPDALGLGGEPEVTPDEELDRWVSSMERCDEDIREGHEQVRDALRASVPAASRTRLIHGDFRLGNTLSKDDRVVSVIDWEIWARSDPRVDVAWFLMMCNPDPELGRRTADGMPSDEELLAVYQDASGLEVKELHWFSALVRYKQAAISALIMRNARRRGEESPVGMPTYMLRSAATVLESA
jgi:aminoglycoside phosphotransferase (APT) family kinase protein